MNDSRAYLPPPPSEAERVFQFSFSTIEPTGVRREWSVRIVPSVAMAVAGFFALAALIPSLTRVLMPMASPPDGAAIVAPAIGTTVVMVSQSGTADNAAMAPGNAFGQAADVITPLNVRDPAALVMGPGL